MLIAGAGLVSKLVAGGRQLFEPHALIGRVIMTRELVRFCQLS